MTATAYSSTIWTADGNWEVTEHCTSVEVLCYISLTQMRNPLFNKATVSSKTSKLKMTGDKYERAAEGETHWKPKYEASGLTKEEMQKRIGMVLLVGQHPRPDFFETCCDSDEDFFETCCDSDEEEEKRDCPLCLIQYKDQINKICSTCGWCGREQCSACDCDCEWAREQREKNEEP